MTKFLIFLEQVYIDKKLEQAPDSSNCIGVFIGTMLPYVILVGIVYAVFRYNKKKIHQD